MSKTILYIASLLAIFSSLTVSAGDTHEFLATNYGWTIDRKLVADIDCPSGQVAFPEGKMVRNWVCKGVKHSFTTFIVWHRTDFDPQNLRNEVFKSMSGDPKFNDAECKSEPVSHKIGGVIQDCSLDVRRRTYYVSFHHFEAGVPASSSGETVKMGFTIRVQNFLSSNSRVGDELRSLISGIQVTGPMTLSQDNKK